MFVLVGVLSSFGCSTIPTGVVATDNNSSEQRPLMARLPQQRTHNTDLLIVLAHDSAGVVSSPGLRSVTMDDLSTFIIGSDGRSTQWRAFLNFDLSTIPRHAHIASAHVVLSHARTSGRNTLTSGLIQAQAVEEPWVREALNWNSQPSSKPSNVAAELQADRDGQLDITSIVRGWAANTVSNHGLVLLSEDPKEAFWTSFVGHLDPSEIKQPRLEIRYSYEPLTPSSRAQ